MDLKGKLCVCVGACLSGIFVVFLCVICVLVFVFYVFCVSVCMCDCVCARVFVCVCMGSLHTLSSHSS